MIDDADAQGKPSGEEDLPSQKPSGGDADGAPSDGGDEFDLIGFSDPEAAGKKPPKGSAAPKAPSVRKPGKPGGYDKAGHGPRREGPGRGPAGRTGARPAGRYGDRREGGRFDRGPAAQGPRRFDQNREAPGPAGRGPRRFDKGPAERGPGRFDRGPGADVPRQDGPPVRRFAPRPAPGLLPPVIRKPASDDVRPYLALKQEKGRFKESRFLLEGAKNIADVLTISPAIFHEVFVSDDFKDKDLIAALKKNRVRVVPVSADDIAALSDTETPQGVIAVANFATLRPDYNLARYVTVLDAVQDPGNVGAILRTSLALGMDAVIMGKGTCDPYNPKVVRSSVGSLLRLPFETNEGLESKIGFLRQKGYSVVASSSHAKITLDQAKLRKKVALLVGNEGAGSGASFLDMADAVVKIPMKNQVESLNVAVAHGILSHQLIHGRV